MSTWKSPDGYPYPQVSSAYFIGRSKLHRVKTLRRIGTSNAAVLLQYSKFSCTVVLYPYRIIAPLASGITERYRYCFFNISYRLSSYLYLRYLSFWVLRNLFFSPFSFHFSLNVLSPIAVAMATKIVTRYPIRIPAEKSCSIFNTTRRTLTSSYRPTALTSLCAQPKPSFFRFKPLQSFQRRPYADIPPPPNPRRRAGFFRWTWRVVYVSAIGGAAYLGLVVYQLRTPPEQFEPDPTKKTLVILGM